MIFYVTKPMFENAGAESDYAASKRSAEVSRGDFMKIG